MNIPKTTLNDYENDDKNQDVGYANLIILAKFYEVSMDCLLGLSDVDRHLNMEYVDLGLNDDVIDLLRERKINTRLLCDLILDPNFTDFMADMAIYIDGLISMRITALNTQLQATRTLLKCKHNALEEDLNMRTILLGQFDETQYFRTIFIVFANI